MDGSEIAEKEQEIYKNTDLKDFLLYRLNFRISKKNRHILYLPRGDTTIFYNGQTDNFFAYTEGTYSEVPIDILNQVRSFKASHDKSQKTLF